MSVTSFLGKEKLLKSLDYLKDKIDGSNDWEEALIRIINAIKEKVRLGVLNDLSKKLLDQAWQEDTTDEEDW